MNITIPIYIEQQPQQNLPPVYVVRPLFVAEPIVQDEELRRAVTKFVKASRKVFDKLGKQMRHAGIAAREGFQKAGLKLEWSEDLIEKLIKAGFDQRYGARPLQRTIETLVVAPIAKHLIANPSLRNTTIRVSLDEEQRLEIST